ncbi:MAG: hypothetical protein ABIL18_07995 [candidate division WOR-3 bacterium]
MRKLWNKLRRFYICHFRKEMLAYNLKRRRGACLQCGRCCKLVYRCPMLVGNGSTMRCLIYNTGRPQQCRVFPLDHADLADVNFRCGYFFDYSPVSDWDTGVLGRG